MPTDFNLKLSEYGFTADTDFHDTTLGFFHDIHNLNQDEENPALQYESFSVQQQPENRSSLVVCDVTCSPTASLDAGIEAILHHWLKELRYRSPRYENIEVTRSGSSAVISCITIAKELACTVTFNLREHSEHMMSQRDSAELSPEQTERMLETMDATFDGSAEALMEKIRPARPGSDNDSRCI